MNTQKDNEVWLGNAPVEGSSVKLQQFENAGISTARLGEQAYDIHGKKLSRDYYLPLFIAKSDEFRYNRWQEEVLRKIRMGTKGAIGGTGVIG